MNTTEQQLFSSILSANPYKNSYVSGISSFLSQNESPSYAKEQFVISYLNTKSFISSFIALSKNIPEADLYDALYNKAYEELALDQALMYQMQYVEIFTKLDNDNRYFYVFMVDPKIVSDTFKTVVNQVKYIDYIIPAALLYRSLYTAEILREDESTHCFVHFQEDETSITIYNKQNFLYTKSINYSFTQMHERFCELKGEMVSYEDFINFITNEDLKTTQSSYKIDIIKLYKEIFTNINDVLTYIKRAQNINKIDCVYIDTQLPLKSKLYEIAEVELNIKSRSFDFDYGFENKQVNIDHFHPLMHLFATLPIKKRYECNFTTYYRPPKFTKRKSGQAIMLAAASVVMAFAYPVTYWSLTYTQSLQYKLLEDEYKQLHVTKLERESTLKIKEAEKKRVFDLLAYEEKEYLEKKNTLIKIHDVKVNYPMKAALMDMFTKDLNSYGVKIESAMYTETLKIASSDKNSTNAGSGNIQKELNLALVATDDKKMTDMIKYMTKIYEGKFHFSIKEISYEEKTKLYFSELKVSLL